MCVCVYIHKTVYIYIHKTVLLGKCYTTELSLQLLILKEMKTFLSVALVDPRHTLTWPKG